MKPKVYETIELSALGATNTDKRTIESSDYVEFKCYLCANRGAKKITDARKTFQLYGFGYQCKDCLKQKYKDRSKSEEWSQKMSVAAKRRNGDKSVPKAQSIKPKKVTEVDKIYQKIKNVLHEQNENSISVFNFLDETHLLFICAQLFGIDNVLNNKGLPEDTRIRPDVFVPNLRLVIEFDGPLHYTDPKTILRDYKKDAFYKENNYNVIKFPYFIQFDYDRFIAQLKELIPNYTPNFKNKIIQCYLDGFIHPEVVLPSSYCELGIERFKQDLIDHKQSIPLIVSTLWFKKKSINDIRYLLPTSLTYLLSCPASKDKDEIIEEIFNIWSVFGYCYQNDYTKDKNSNGYWDVIHEKGQEIRKNKDKSILTKQYEVYKLADGDKSFDQFVKEVDLFLKAGKNVFVGYSYYSREFIKEVFCRHYKREEEYLRIFISINSITLLD